MAGYRGSVYRPVGPHVVRRGVDRGPVGRVDDPDGVPVGGLGPVDRGGLDDHGGLAGYPDQEPRQGRPRRALAGGELFLQGGVLPPQGGRLVVRRPLVHDGG
jgi:hypothetical protein